MTKAKKKTWLPAITPKQGRDDALERLRELIESMRMRDEIQYAKGYDRALDDMLRVIESEAKL